jgi:hypothetical protein
MVTGDGLHRSEKVSGIPTMSGRLRGGYQRLERRYLDLVRDQIPWA